MIAFHYLFPLLIGEQLPSLLKREDGHGAVLKHRFELVTFLVQVHQELTELDRFCWTSTRQTRVVIPLITSAHLVLQ